MRSLDTEALKKQAVVDFSARKKVAGKTTVTTSTDKEEMKQKIARAKEHANDELIAFRSIIETAMEQINQLALFDNVSNLLDDICIKTVLEEIVEPIIKGNKNPYMDDDTYKKMRQGMYKALIYKYEKE